MGSEMCIRDRSLTVYEIQPSSAAPHTSKNTPSPTHPPDNAYVPEDHPRVYFSTLARHSKADVVAAHLSEFGSDLVSGTALMDDASFTTRIGIHSGVRATRSLMAVALPDSGSPQTFITASCWQHIVNAGAADDHCITVSPRVFGGLGSSTAVTVDQSVRLSVQFFDDTGPTARLAVWALLVPDGSMSVDVLLGRDSWLRFSTHTYTTDSPVSNRPLTGRLKLGHLDTD